MNKPFQYHHLFQVIVLVLLALLSIPWYWPKDMVEPVIIGLPIWAFVSLLFSVAFAIATAFFIMKNWNEDNS